MIIIMDWIATTPSTIDEQSPSKRLGDMFEYISENEDREPHVESAETEEA